jgi:hypothetical protein
MKHRLAAFVTCCIALLSVQDAQASLLFASFKDISESSPSKRFKVEAKSPDNRPNSGGRRTWQSNFVFTCTDTRTGKVLWSRKQKQDDEREGPPVELFVSDSGWTAVRTFGFDVVCIDPKGAERGKVDVIHAFTAVERKDYVHWTTGGYSWSGHSIWYFLDTDDRHLFVIRPWWGRRIIIDVELGSVAEPSPRILNAIDTHERDFVLSELAAAVKTRDQWETKSADTSGDRFVTAALLAGQLKVAKAAPELKKLQGSLYSGRSTLGSLSEEFDDEIDHRTYTTLSMRQVAQLSLRRLGHAPECEPVLLFSKRFKDYKRDMLYRPKLHETPRHTRIDAVQKGMKAEEVLDLIGFPDFVGRDDTWEYDMDSTPAQTLILNWTDRRVDTVEKQVPALWQKDLVRDEQLAD